jgi:hypothetical protein
MGCWLGGFERFEGLDNREQDNSCQWSGDRGQGRTDNDKGYDGDSGLRLCSGQNDEQRTGKGKGKSRFPSHPSEQVRRGPRIRE